MEDCNAIFDKILETVSHGGRFQRRFNILFNFLLPVAATMTYMNLILVMVVPDFWCYVPGRDNTNITIDKWKEMTLPRKKDLYGEESFSSCKMYNETYSSADNNSTAEDNIIGCQYGYEYNKTWYDTTVPSTLNWVCDKMLYSANVIAAAKLGEVFGVLILGYIGDWIGRRPAFFISLLLTLISRLITPFVIEWYPVFLTMSIIATFPSMTVSQICMVTLMEISPAEDRAFYAQIQNIGWTVGLSILPLIYWVLGDWVVFMFVTTAPLGIFLLLSIFMIESPRWLLSRGKVTKCLEQLNTIAKVNGTELSPNSAILLQNNTPPPEKVYGAGSLFSSVRLAKNTMLLIAAWMCCILNYNTIVLNSSNMKGNPFMNFFLQSLAEGPPYIFGKALCDKIGRRFTAMLGFLVGIIAYVLLVFTIQDTEKQWFHISMLVIGKFSISIIYFVVCLQSLELYPTSVRQSAYSLCFMSANVFGSLSPYVVHLGLVIDPRLPFAIMAVTSIIGVVSELFLPETVNEQLPETMVEAKKFGLEQKYFRLPNKKPKHPDNADEEFIEKEQSEMILLKTKTNIEK